MRILHVIPSVAPAKGGPSQAVLELVRAIRPLGVNAEIVCTNDDGPGVVDVPLRELTSFEGAPVRFFPRLSSPIRGLREFAFSAELARWLKQHIGDYSLVHVHALWSHAPSFAMRLAHRRGLPYINRPSGSFCRWSMQHSPVRKRLFLALVERANMDRAAALEFTAEQERDETAEMGFRAPGFIMPYGLHIPELIPDAHQRLRAELRIAGDDPVILFFSRLHPKKGAHLLLQALGRITQRRFTLVVAGSGPPEHEAHLRNLASTPKLAGRVHFVGFARGNFKQLLLQGSDLFALPSYSESFAIAVMEALAAGTPVLTTPGVPLAYLVQKFNLGWITAPDAEVLAGSLAGALDQLQDKGALGRQRERARSLVASNFSWPQIAARMSKVYDAILNHRTPPSFELAEARLQIT